MNEDKKLSMQKGMISVNSHEGIKLNYTEIQNLHLIIVFMKRKRKTCPFQKLINWTIL